MRIANKVIGPNYPPFVIAEMSGNHNQNLDRAMSIVEAAAESGVHALKLQTYTADTMTLDISDREFFISDEKNLWTGQSLYELYGKAATPWEWHQPIMQRCLELGMICFSTPFDATAVDFLEKLNCPAYKIASFENADLPLIRKVAATRKPIIISTGMATISELAETVAESMTIGREQLALLKCTSTYPASPENTNILTIPHLRDLFQCEVGLSDHTMGLGTAIAAVAHGASIIEKHFTLSREDGGVDAAFSMEPAEMKQLVHECERAWQSLGSIHYGSTRSEESSMQFRRSLYVSQNIKAGDILSHENIRSVRPGLGLPPKYLNVLLGCRVTRDLPKGTPLTWELLS